MAIVAIQNPAFQKAMRVITAITNSDPAVITTSFAHNYITGQIVRIYIPPYFGMTQINRLTGTIAVLTDTQFAIDINTTNFDTFVVPLTPAGYLPPGVQLQYATVVPVGEVTSSLSASTVNVLPYP